MTGFRVQLVMISIAEATNTIIATALLLILMRRLLAGSVILLFMPIVFWGRLDAECIRERFLEKQSEIRLRS